MRGLIYYKLMTTPIIIACCIVIPLSLLSVAFITDYKDKKRKVWKEEQEKIRTYGDQINKESRKNLNEKKKFIY